MSAFSNETEQQLQALYAQMRPRHLYPLWEVLSALVTPEPASPVQAEKWVYADVRDFLMRAGDLISAHDAERRVLILENPGMPGSSGITSSLYAGLQLILPGEVAPCHRHSQCALRFVMEGDSAFTAIDGERAIMRPFDLILTPNWQWHDHGNSTDKPMIWLDGLDIPTVRHFDASFAEKLGENAHPETLPPGDTMKRYGRNLRPFRGSSQDRRPGNLPIFHYPYTEWKESLAALAAREKPDAHLGFALEFINPATGGHVMPTIAAHVRLLPHSFETRLRRSSDGTVMVVVEGEGIARIGEVDQHLSQGDIFVVPSWHSLELQARADLTLFAFSDRAAQEALQLYREEKL
jgi:gentisate 1,2-dioxygenase